MGISTTADIAGFFNDLFEDAMDVFRAQNLMVNLVTLYNGTGLAPRKQGIFPALTSQIAQEGTLYSNAQTWNTTSKMELTPIIRHSQSIVTQSMIDTDNEATMENASDTLGQAMASDVDTDLLSNFANFSTGLGAAGQALTLGIAAAAVARLQAGKIPMPYVGVLHPYGWHDLWVQLGQPAATYDFLGDVANQALRDYAVSRFNGMTWYTSANIEIDVETDAIGAVFHREALAFDVRQAPMLNVTTRPDIVGYGYQLDLEMWYAHGERRDEAGVKLTHDATAPTGA